MSEQDSTVFGGRYELHRRLARGGMAEVFLARDQLLDRPVAVKVLFQEFAADPSFVERFRREAQAAANLSHPNIVGVYDWGREDSTYYIVMEYVEGRSLSEIIRTDGPMDSDRVAEIAEDVAAALGFAHKNDVVHRDMKSGNVIVSPSGQVKVADFGIATAISGGAQANLTQTGAVMGTATYFSPEQAQGRPLDGRSDLYSLGVVMYEMLTGSAPFTGDNPVAIAYKHVQERPEPIARRRPDVPEALQAITAKLLNKDPELRYPTAADLQADLRRFQAGGHTLSSDAAAAAGMPPVPITPPDRPAEAAATPPPQPTPAPPPQQYQVPPHQTQVNPVTRPPTGGRPPHDPYGDPYYDDYDDYDDRRDNRVWLWILAAAGLLILLVALIVVLWNVIGDDGGGSDVPVEGTPTPDDTVGMVIVPNVLQQDRQTAVDLLQERGLAVGVLTTEERTDIEPDRVLAQDPAPGTELEEGDTVDLTVSVGPEAVEVPGVVGLTEAEALNALARAGFENVEVEMIESNEYDVGIVAEQQPAASELLEPTGVVTISVSEGPSSVIVPNLEGQAEDDAIDILEEIGWRVEVEEVESLDIAEGFVVDTDPGAGTDLDLDDPLTLRVSSGPPIVRVPNVIGQTPEDAEDTLAADDLIAVPDTCIIDDPANQVPGTVIEQIPAGGVSVEAGTDVVVCVGEEPAPTPTPEPTPTPTPTATPTPTPEPTPTPTPTPDA